MNQLAKNQAKKLRRAIMRRVWYAYTLSIMLRPAAAQGFLFGASVIGFWKLASVTDIIHNFLQVKVGDLPLYIVQALVQAHVLALIAFGIIVFTTLSFGVRIALPRFSWTHQMQSV
jgi:hypothetical protein